LKCAARPLNTPIPGEELWPSNWKLRPFLIVGYFSLLRVNIFFKNTSFDLGMVKELEVTTVTFEKTTLLRKFVFR
jgi:hypothetical protein